MNKAASVNKSDGTFDNNDGSKRKLFVLWREVLMGYAAPAIMASIGGLIIGDKELQLAALTTIGGTSAFIAWMLGLWLIKRGIHKKWIVRAPHLLIVGMFALVGNSFGLLLAWMTSDVVGTIFAVDHLTWVDRVWIDFPTSGLIASTIVTWRWHLAVAPKRRR
ncbi:hypothetical protein [Paenibacillus sp. L3-i20]|uniref:hypothetical protein n=1 Tax=Paenibacillus sp. L3-i20 TaxID=2905833 RepID=UPI001EDDFF55|nr:hypothetical protein [Paenibacillus sp. L3-i20]GKU78813.1 hypothetical protein L3i20_v232100 [Paenibacillus sp. L3-i20]